MRKIGANRRTPRKISADSAPGFTLIEILIAVTILAFIIGTVYATFLGSMNTIDRVEKTSEVYHLGRLILQQFIMDLESVYFDESRVRASDSEEQQVFTGKEVAGDVSEQRLDQLSFLTTSSRITESGSGVSQLWRVTYVLVPDEKSGNYQLIRRAVPSLYDETSTGQGDEEETGKEYDFLLSSRVRSLKFEYVDLQGDKKDSWDPQNNTSEPLVPPEVKISVTLDNPEGEPISFNTRVFLPLALKKGNGIRH